jgi:hypothetical protein
MTIMKINVSQEVLEADGKTVVASNPGLPISNTNPPMTLRGVCIHAMLQPYPNQHDENGRLVAKGDDGNMKLKKFTVFEKLRDAKLDRDNVSLWVELTSEDITLLKDWIKEFQPQLVCGQCVKMLESPTS